MEPLLGSADRGIGEAMVGDYVTEGGIDVGADVEVVVTLEEV